MYTTNSGSHTKFAQVSLQENHKPESYEYTASIKRRIEAEMPECKRICHRAESWMQY
jgi:hypothetical protein